MAWVPWAQMMVTPLDRTVQAPSVPPSSCASAASGKGWLLRTMASRAPEGGLLHDIGRVGRVRGQPQRQGMQQVGVAQRCPQEILAIIGPACHLLLLTTLLPVWTSQRPR
jgi:hypothetical protein